METCDAVLVIHCVLHVSRRLRYNNQTMQTAQSHMVEQGRCNTNGNFRFTIDNPIQVPYFVHHPRRCYSSSAPPWTGFLLVDCSTLLVGTFSSILHSSGNYLSSLNTNRNELYLPNGKGFRRLQQPAIGGVGLLHLTVSAPLDAAWQYYSLSACALAPLFLAGLRPARLFTLL
jgi:hypothetical protein